MLKRTDNPQLFYHVALAYAKIDKNFNNITAQVLTDQQLAKISNLNIKPSSLKETNISSLSGIEQLTNLEELSIPGQSATNYARDFNECYERSKTVANYDLESDLNFFKKEYDSCQLNDEEVQKIQNLPKLKKLDLSNQRKLTQIDFSNNPNLININMRGSTSLKQVKGLDKLNVLDPKTQVNEDDFENSNFEFGGCEVLKDIDNHDQLFDKMAQHPESSDQARLHLPTITYAALYRKEKETGTQALKKLNDYESSTIAPVDWVETNQGGVRAKHNSRQMDIVTKRVSNIIRTVCKGTSNSNIAHVAEYYRYLCDNLKYDYEGLEKQKNGTGKEREKYKNSIRSSYVTLMTGKGVCTGIGNAFRYGVNLMGFQAVHSVVKGSPAKDDELSDSRAIIGDHDITKMHINNQPYYFDPTWDLGTKQSKYFGLTYDEMSKDHNFNVNDFNNGKGAPSIQGTLQSENMLQTNYDPKKVYNQDNDQEDEHNL